MSLSLLFKSLRRRKVVTLLLLIQLAMTMALLCNSVLLARQTQQQLNQPTGLNLQDTLVVQLKPTSKALTTYPALGDLLERQLSAVGELSGVHSVAYTNQAPLLQGGNNGNIYDIDNEELTNINKIPLYYASKDIFAALQLEVIAGELPDAPVPESSDAVAPVVLTQSLAKAVFGDQVAVGKQSSHGRVAAVVKDFYGQRTATHQRYNMLNVAPLMSVDWGYSIVVRAHAGRADSVRHNLSETLREVDPNIEIFYVRNLEEQHHRLYRNEFGLATLLAILSGLMLLVSMISSYSCAWFHALKQQQEIGIKRALGASRRLIFAELFSESWLNTLLGSLFGAALALVLNYLLSKAISIPALSLGMPLAICATLLLCVTVATWYPAAIATRVSPATATKTL